MAGGFQNLGKDSLDITELASLNDDISDDLIDKLEHEISEKMGIKIEDEATEVNENDDSTLFEEPAKAEEVKDSGKETSSTEDKVTESENKKTEQKSDLATEKPTEEKPESQKDVQQETSKPDKSDAIQNFDDNFIKKYKAKLKNRAQGGSQAPSYGGVAPDEENAGNNAIQNTADAQGDITALSNGNITERPLTSDQKKYNDSLDFLDKNVKYSKYVIYIDPQNVNFIDSLTIKERKNLINGILRQQDDIAITKLRFKVIQTIIRHVIITVLTLAISIPVVYHVINASLEATINNHRNAQTNWQTLYKEHGKITQH